MKTYVKKSSNFSISTKQSPCVNGQTVNSKLTFFRQIMTCVSSDDGHHRVHKCRAQRARPQELSELMLRGCYLWKEELLLLRRRKNWGVRALANDALSFIFHPMRSENPFFCIPHHHGPLFQQKLLKCNFNGPLLYDFVWNSDRPNSSWNSVLVRQLLIL